MTRTLKKYGEQLPFFLLTIPLFIIVHVEKEYHKLIDYRFVYSSILELLVAPVFMLIFSFLLFRSRRKAFMFSFFLMLVFYFLTTVRDTFQQSGMPAFLGKYSVLLAATALTSVLVYRALRKSGSDFRKAFLFINSVFLILIIFDVVVIAGHGAEPDNKLVSSEKSVLATYRKTPESVKPDIYYMVFDSYTSPSALKSSFGYENSALDSFLVNRGFFVANNSHSQYNLTAFSLTSSFNMNYLDRLKVSENLFRKKEYLPAVSAMYETDLMKILEKENYEIVNQSIFKIKNHPPVAPLYNIWMLNELYEKHNILRSVSNDLGWMLQSNFAFHLNSKEKKADENEASRNRHVERTYEALMNTIATPSLKPRFVYTHFMIPHYPFSYDSAGNKLPETEHDAPLDMDMKHYVNQLIYSNKLMKNAVEKIMSEATKPVVIIIQGDHGYRHYLLKEKSLEFDNLNAFYFYNKDYRLLTDHPSNVNTFRIVLNTFFNQNLPMLKDTSYYLRYK